MTDYTTIAPTITSDQWHADAGNALKSVSDLITTIPDGHPFITGAALISAGLSALWIIGRVAPAFPMLGPMVGGFADIAWNVLAHKDQKSADVVKDTIHDYAPELAAAVAIAKEGNMVRVPPQLEAAVNALVKA